MLASATAGLGPPFSFSGPARRLAKAGGAGSAARPSHLGDPRRFRHLTWHRRGCCLASTEMADFDLLDALTPLPPAELPRQWRVGRSPEAGYPGWTHLTLGGWHLQAHPDAAIATAVDRTGAPVGWIIGALQQDGPESGQADDAGRRARLRRGGARPGALWSRERWPRGCDRPGGALDGDHPRREAAGLRRGGALGPLRAGPRGAWRRRPA